MSNSSEQCVAIIGAGVSGLVAAVNMLKVGIRPTVFEKTSGIGGLWNADLAPCWYSLRTNISKFWTVLPDFSWPSHAHLFPTQREVFSYLLNYVQQSLSSDVFLFNTNVTNISRTNDETNRWIVQYCTENGDSTSEQYDFVIVASGLFSHPQISEDIIGLSSFPGTILHSSDYRSPDQVCGKRLIVVGSSVSAAEVAADMASKADHIIHIASHKFWPLSRFTPVVPTDPASPFLPIDFNSYRRSMRTSSSEVLLRSTNDYRKLNAYNRSSIGGDQPFSHLSDSEDDQPPFITISSMYLGWYRSGRISVQRGRLNKVNENGTLILDNGTAIDTTCDDVLVLCTGYRPQFDFFSSDILEQLSYKPNDIFCPLILYRNVLPLNLSGLAFIGICRKPYWMYIELQARWTAAIFSGILPMPSESEQQNGINIQHLLRNQQPRPQSLLGDPVGATDNLAKDIGLIPSDVTDSVLATHYRIGGPDPAVIAEYNTIVEAASQGRFVAGIAFCALHGTKWIYERTLTGQTAAGTDRGHAQFNLFEQGQLLYLEEGELILSSSSSTIAKPLHATQKYMYVYDEDADSLTAYFVEKGNMRGSLFHTIQFQPKISTEQAGWTAVGHHQCNDDHYCVSYLFVFTGIQLARFEITYLVNGPANDYVSTIIFRPDQ